MKHARAESLPESDNFTAGMLGDYWPGIQIYYPPVKYAPALGLYEDLEQASQRKLERICSKLRLHPGDSNSSWWVRFGSALPLAALVLGLVFIQNLHSRSQIGAAAEVDAALLGDAVPVAAYGDPGFVEFLKAARD